jgi:putative ABC transport system ATP-binding protein
MSNIFYIKELRKVYFNKDVSTVAIDGIDLQIEKGEFVAVMGPSGCGKSSLLNILGLLDTATSGDFYFIGQRVALLSANQRTLLRRNHIGFIFQNFNLIDELTVFENIELPLLYTKMSKENRRKIVCESMENMDIVHKMNFFPQQLSGGLQQRAAVCRAVVANPDVILADEPTGNLDSTHGQMVMQLLSKLNQKGTTIVMVTHAQAYASYAQRVVHLFDGHLVTDALI